MPEPRYVEQGATFDGGRTYRYRLWRVWDARLPRVAFMLLNPSTADEEVLDPTLRRCLGFALAWGCGSMEVGNAFALRSTDPTALYAHPDPVGPRNDSALRGIATRATFGVVVGWGVHASKLPGRRGTARQSRAAEAEAMLSPLAPLLCLGTTAEGHPRHPLYLRGDTCTEAWRGQPLSANRRASTISPR